MPEPPSGQVINVREMYVTKRCVLEKCMKDSPKSRCSIDKIMQITRCQLTLIQNVHSILLPVEANHKFSALVSSDSNGTRWILEPVCSLEIYSINQPKGKVQKKRKKKLTSVSFMYVCVAGNGEMLVFFSFFPKQ